MESSATMVNSTSITRDEARELVQSMTYMHGYVSHADRATMSDSVRRNVEKALEKKDVRIAASVDR